MGWNLFRKAEEKQVDSYEELSLLALNLAFGKKSAGALKALTPNGPPVSKAAVQFELLALLYFVMDFAAHSNGVSGESRDEFFQHYANECLRDLAFVVQNEDVGTAIQTRLEHYSRRVGEPNWQRSCFELWLQYARTSASSKKVAVGLDAPIVIGDFFAEFTQDIEVIPVFAGAVDTVWRVSSGIFHKPHSRTQSETEFMKRSRKYLKN
jgi:hypothetical protein